MWADRANARYFAARGVESSLIHGGPNTPAVVQVLAAFALDQVLNACIEMALEHRPLHRAAEVGPQTAHADVGDWRAGRSRRQPVAGLFRQHAGDWHAGSGIPVRGPRLRSRDAPPHSSGICLGRAAVVSHGSTCRRAGVGNGVGTCSCTQRSPARACAVSSRLGREISCRSPVAWRKPSLSAPFSNVQSQLL